MKTSFSGLLFSFAASNSFGDAFLLCFFLAVVVVGTFSLFFSSFSDSILFS